MHELRYERVCLETEAAADELATLLEASVDDVRRALASARQEAVGRYRRDLTAEQIADVEAEAGGTLRELGYEVG